MKIKVLLFAALSNALGISELALELSHNATAQDAIDEIIRRYPKMASMTGRIAVAVNHAYVAPSHRLAEGDEVALIPPVSGG